jgi:U6 snRNA-associated Sm-like protein LSm5
VGKRGELFVLNQHPVGGCDVLTYFCSHFLVVKSVFLAHPASMTSIGSTLHPPQTTQVECEGESGFTTVKMEEIQILPLGNASFAFSTHIYSHKTNENIELIDKHVGQKIRVLLRTPTHELTGTLCGFDDFVNMVLTQVTEKLVVDGNVVERSVDRILLNGNLIALIQPI